MPHLHDWTDYTVSCFELFQIDSVRIGSKEHSSDFSYSSADVLQENDIVLCDGPCNRGYHEACIAPNFKAADVDDESWLCPPCQTKV